MRRLSIMVCLLAAVALSACDFWPRDLAPLAESIGRQVSGEASAWRVGADVVVIDVVNSPYFAAPPAELEALVTGIAEQVLADSGASVESIVVTFYENAVPEDEEHQREFIFLVVDGRPVLQPPLDFDATGPLTLQEIRTHFIDRMGETLTPEARQCILDEAEKLAREVGDPEMLDPASVPHLSADSWAELDPFVRRLILAQSVSTQAMFACL